MADHGVLVDHDQRVTGVLDERAEARLGESRLLGRVPAGQGGADDVGSHLDQLAVVRIPPVDAAVHVECEEPDHRGLADERHRQ